MKNLTSHLLFILSVLVGLASCKKDRTVTVEKPTIAITEAGLKNSKIGYVGTAFQIGAKIVAPGRVASIKLQITRADSNYGWDLVNTYTTGYAGSEKIEFDEHVDIPADARAGTYTLLLIVTDKYGERAQDKIDFEIVKDPTLPSVSNDALTLANPALLNYAANIRAPNKLARLTVEVQSSVWTKVFEYTDADMVGETTYALNKNIDISDSPSGHYHINIAITDQAGKQISYSYHLDK